MAATFGSSGRRQCGRQPCGGRLVGQPQGFYNGFVTFDSTQFVSLVQDWARELGFSQIAVAPVDLSSAEPGLLAWLSAGYHGKMDYMQRHGLRGRRPGGGR